ncbi:MULTISPECIES: TetR/AcrR family transcriptional regulator [Microbacterium]|uniref:Transcriptional regulator, TetR family n=1 Tax=Microbacterium testaceum (strain StLB037) TaxID=979556 RepID=A0A1H0QN74_MICTS|nr:TetR family transcriptional regulator [Microbacterium testaceum]SDP18722.1 transcriptional regulator, TetR family [Microbacterium testaceum StLB037]
MSETTSRPMRARGRARRELLLDATIAIIAEGGIAAVTHRSVAAAAGVPHSSTTYFFDSLDDMIGEAVAHAMAAELERLEQFRSVLVSGANSPGAAIDEFVEIVRSQSQDHTVAQFEIYLFASRHPALRVHVEKILDETRALAAAVLQTNGVTDPHAAAAVVALIDGFALHRIARSEEVQFQSLAHALRAAIVGFVTLAATSSLGEGDLSPA